MIVVQKHGAEDPVAALRNGFAVVNDQESLS